MGQTIDLSRLQPIQLKAMVYDARMKIEEQKQLIKLLEKILKRGVPNGDREKSSGDGRKPIVQGAGNPKRTVSKD